MSRELPYSPVLYAFSHCLTMIPIVADARLKMSAVNHSVFNHMAYTGAVEDGVLVAVLLDEGWAVSMKEELTERLASCVEICTRIALV